MAPSKELTADDLPDDELITRCWEIANLPPEATNGSLSGQVAALDLIRYRLGFGTQPSREELAEAVIEVARAVSNVAVGRRSDR